LDKEKESHFDEKELIISFERNNEESEESLTEKIENKRIIMNQSEDQLSLFKDKEPLIESKTFKVISRSGINKLGNVINDQNPSESHSKKRKIKLNKKIKNQESTGLLNKKKLREKQNNLKLSKIAQSQKVVERRKRKVSKVKKKDKKKTETRLKVNNSKNQFKRSQGCKYF
jgi:hypothetical protein